jgi:hypothetical protein
MKATLQKIKIGRERMKEEVNSNQEEMNAKMTCIKRRWRPLFTPWRHGDKTMARQEMTEACLECKEPTSEGWESRAEHREVPKKEAIAKSSAALKKWHRAGHLATGHCSQLEERTPEEIGHCPQKDDLTWRSGIALGARA